MKLITIELRIRTAFSYAIDSWVFFCHDDEIYSKLSLLFTDTN